MLTRDCVDRFLGWCRAERTTTPALFHTPAAVRAAVATLRAGLGAEVSYATKANAHPFMLAELADTVDEFNVTNLAHAKALLDQGIAPDRIAFVNPVTPDRVLAAVADLGVDRFVVDDLRGLDAVRKACGQPKLTLRVRPPDIGQSARSVVRFGNTPETVTAIAGQAARFGIEIEALSFFVGTSGDDMANGTPFKLGIDRLAQVHESLARLDIPVRTVNLGGGFAGARRQFFADHPGFFAAIRDELAARFGTGAGVRCEPGRFLSEPSMAAVAQVIADRVLDGNRIVHLDISAYTGLFESCFIDGGGENLHLFVTGKDEPAAGAAVVGPVMDSFDVVKRHASLPPLDPGDLVLIPNVGAYSWGYTSTCEGLPTLEPIPLPGDLDRELATATYA